LDDTIFVTPLWLYLGITLQYIYIAALAIMHGIIGLDRCVFGPAGAVEAGSRAAASRPALGTAAR
jgi:hypothetical protein